MSDVFALFLSSYFNVQFALMCQRFSQYSIISGEVNGRLIYVIVANDVVHVKISHSIHKNNIIAERMYNLVENSSVGDIVEFIDFSCKTWM